MLHLQVRLSTSDLRAPLRGVQAMSAQHAAALLQLSEQQAALQRQLGGIEELLGALQGVSAKQFKVTCDNKPAGSPVSLQDGVWV